jgi:hypothetical protein
MYGQLYEFFVRYQHLSLPGIGILLIERKPASLDFPSKQIDPPLYTVVLHPVSTSPYRKFLGWLANHLHISDS